MQLVAVQLLPEFAAADVHDATSVDGVFAVLQVTVVKLLPELAVCGEQLDAPFGPMVVVEQVVVL